MNKKLLTMAVAAGLVMPAVALADVTISGKMDVSYNNVDGDGAGFSNDNLSSNSSKLVIKGSEKLGNGMTANFFIDSDVRASGSNGAWTSRNTWAGLKGDWGEVRIGKHDTPFKSTGRSVDFFESEHMGENRVLVNNYYTTNTNSVGWDPRINVIAYLTPNLNGFSGVIAWSPDDGGGDGGITAANNDDNGAWSVSGKYANGPWMVGAAYEEHDKNMIGGGAATDEDAWRFVGKYSANGFTVAGMYQTMDDLGGAKGIDGDAWTIGASYAFGNNTVKLTYGEADHDVAAGRDGESDMWVIGLDHNFSKRTKIYVNYANLDNNTASAATLDSSGFDTGGDTGGSQGAAGDDHDGWTIGLRHNF